jgi:hypothetical protein
MISFQVCFLLKFYPKQVTFVVKATQKQHVMRDLYLIKKQRWKFHQGTLK